MRDEIYQEPLYAIADRYREIIGIEADSDEAKGALRNALDEVQEQFDLKAESIIRFIRNLEAQADAVKSEEERLAARRKAVENKAAWLKDYIADTMRSMNLREVKAGIFEAKFRKNPASPNITNKALIPAQYFTPQEPRINNAAIKDALKAGEAIEGAELVQGESLSIR
jgi:hypothetical protein